MSDVIESLSSSQNGLRMILVGLLGDSSICDDSPALERAGIKHHKFGLAKYNKQTNTIFTNYVFHPIKCIISTCFIK